MYISQGNILRCQTSWGEAYCSFKINMNRYINTWLIEQTKGIPVSNSIFVNLWRYFWPAYDRGKSQFPLQVIKRYTWRWPSFITFWIIFMNSLNSQLDWMTMLNAFRYFAIVRPKILFWTFELLILFTAIEYLIFIYSNWFTINICNIHIMYLTPISRTIKCNDMCLNSVTELRIYFASMAGFSNVYKMFKL